MNALEELLDNFWIVKEENPSKYYEIKDNIKKYSEFIKEKLRIQISYK